MELQHDDSGERIAGRWELRQPVGRGGMGTVYRAIDTSSGQPVAVKLLHTDGDNTDERFMREVKALAELRHPSIVTYLSHGHTHDNRSYLVMEWLEGEDLSKRLKRHGSLSVGQILDIAIQVAEALEFAHGRGVIHRDIKPANIFLHRDTVVKVLDFGIARKVGAATLTQTGAVVGTIEYMSPEQIRSSRLSESRSDVYSLGCVLYECLSGAPPFTGTLMASILANILFEQPQPLAAANPTLPRALTDLVHAMIHKEPNERPSAASEPLRQIRRQIDETLLVPENRPVAISAKMVMTHSELRMLTAVLASPDGGFASTPSGSETLPFGPPSEAVPDGNTKQAELPTGLYPGVRMTNLADGWLLGVFERVGQVGLQEQVYHAAQLARDIKLRRPMAQIAIAVSHAGGTHPTLVGPLVETCTKMLANINAVPEAASQPTGIWLDEVSATMLAARFNVESTPVGNRLRDRRTTNNSQVLFLGKPIQCVGRDTELSTLDLWVNSSFEDSQARAVLLVATAGLGKTRLLVEFLQRLEQRHPSHLLFSSRCDPLTESTPYGPLQEALRSFFGLQGGQADAVQKQKLYDAVLQKVPHDVSRIVEFLGELIGVSFPSQDSPQLAAARHDPKVMNDQITLALTDFFAASCAEHPVLLVIEDLQFSDSLTIQMVESLLHELKDKPFVVLAAARPEVNDKFPQLWTSVQKDVLQLRGLNKKSAERLVMLMLGAGTAQVLVERMVQLADGNALFLEELIRTVSVEQRDTLPLTILAVLQQRVQALPADARRTLRAASIFGQVFWKGGLTQLTGLSENEVDEWLLYLGRAEVIERRRHSRFAKDTEYAFRHALMREAVNRMVTDEDRSVGHGLAAHYLIKAGEQDAFVLAAHFEQSGQLLEAGKYNVRAAAECLARHDGAGARKGAQRAIDQGVEGELRGTAASILAQALYWGVEWQPVPTLASEALSLCSAGSTEYCRALSVFMMTAVMTGQQEHIGPLVGKFLTTQPQPEAVDAYTEAGSFMVLMFVMLAERSLVETFLGRLGQVITGAPEFSLSRAMLSFCHGAYLRLLSPEPWRAAELLRDAHARFQKAGDIRNESLSGCLMALAEREIGNFETGEQALTAALQLAERIAGTMVPTVQMHVAFLYEHATDDALLDKAFDIAREVMEKFTANAVYVALAQGIVARGLLHQGKTVEAVQLAEVAKTALAQTPTMQAIAVPTWVDALTKAGRIEDAAQAARDLIALYTKLGDAGYLEPIGRMSASAALALAGHSEEAAAQRLLAKTHTERRAERAPTEDARRQFVFAVPENARALALT
jgi:serine/threonine protein kinase